MRTALLLLPVLALWRPGPALAEDPPALERRSYDLAWLASRPAVPGPALGLHRTAPSRGAWEDEDEDDLVALPADTVAGLVRDLLHPEQWGGESGAEVRAEGGRLHVAAPPAVQAEVAALLDGLWGELAGRVRLEAHVLRLTPESFEALPAEGLRAALLSGRPTPEQVRDLVERAGQGGEALHLSTLARPGQWAALERTTAHTWLVDYEVEIAQDSVVSNPIVERVLTGLRLDLRASPLPGGAVRLDALVDLVEPLGEPRRVDLEAEPFGSLDLPTVRVLRLSSVLSLAAGETGALLARTDEDVRVVLLSATPTPAPAVAAAALVRRLDLGALVTPRVTTWLTRNELQPAPAPNLVLLLQPEDAPLLEEDDLVALLTPRGASEVAKPWSLVQSGALWVPAAEADRLGERLRALAAPLLARERLVVIVRERPTQGPPRERAVLALDVASGLPFAAQHAVERSYLAEWDVEVAQEARTGDPIPGTLCAGLFLQGRVDAGPVAARAQVAFDAVLSRQRGEFERFNPRNVRTGILERAVLEVLRGNRDGPVTRGEPVVLELGADAAGTRVEVEARLWR